MWERSASRTNFLGCEALVHKDLELGPFGYDFTYQAAVESARKAGNIQFVVVFFSH